MTRKRRVPANELELATVALSQHGRVLVAEVVNPPHNYLTGQMVTDLRALVAAVEFDETVGAVVLTGGLPGKYITHLDIVELERAALSVPAMPPALARGLFHGARALARVVGERAVAATPARGVLAITRFHDLVTGLLRSPAVWIGMVDGPCGGGGLELSVGFDLRVASRERARFLLPELSIGLITTGCGQRLAQLIGPARTMEMLLEARAYSAAEALEMGLVNRVLPVADIVEQTMALARRCAARPRRAVAAQKRVVNAAFEISTRQGLTREGLAQMVGVPTANTKAALRGWLEMREPGGDSVFLTDPGPWTEGSAVDLNATR